MKYEIVALKKPSSRRGCTCIKETGERCSGRYTHELIMWRPGRREARLARCVECAQRSAEEFGISMPTVSYPATAIHGTSDIYADIRNLIAVAKQALEKIERSLPPQEPTA